MTIHSHLDIQAHAQSIRSLERRPWGGYLPSEVYNLRILAVMCGYPGTRMDGISNADLKELLKAALRSGASAIMVTARIARANGVEIDGAAQVGALPDILSGPDPLPEPFVPAAPPGSGVEYATVVHLERRLRQLKEWAGEQDQFTIEALQTGINTLAADLPGMVAKALAERTATNLVVTLPLRAPVPLGLVHRQTPRIIRALNAGLNVYLHGPAGSGKTTVGKKAAEAFGLPFYTAAKVESEYLLLGFRDAKGDVVRTPFREAYEHGGVFLFDELDASSPGAIVALNMALANGVCPFPDGLIERHPNFKCIAAGNTVLTGATRQYAGRNQMDAASVDRFYFIEFPYDEALEMELASNKEWCKYVQAIRVAVAERGMQHLVTPRATFDGCKALEVGDTWEEAAQACIFKGLDEESVQALKRTAKYAIRTADDVVPAVQVL